METSREGGTLCFSVSPRERKVKRRTPAAFGFHPDSPSCALHNALANREPHTGAGIFGGAGVFGFYAVGALTAAAILGLATAVAAWLAALIVTAVLGGLAGILALQGRTKVQQATPPVPEQATESVKEDVQWAKTRAQAARQ